MYNIYSIKSLLEGCGVTTDSWGNDFIKTLAEEFVTNAVDGAYAISRRRNADKIDAVDLALYLSK